MKSTGIIFSTPMVIADISGKKFQTRRTWGLKKINENPDDWELVAVFQDGLARFYNHITNVELIIKCPYGGAGDEIYLRETWAISSFSSNFAKEQQLQVAYKAGVFAIDRDMTHDLEWRTVDKETWNKYTQPKYGNWQSSMFMPKWASRRKHILSNIRCERVQSITEADAIKEGIEQIMMEPDEHTNKALRSIGAKEVTEPYSIGYRDYLYKIDKRAKFNSNITDGWYGKAIPSYKALWDFINGKKYPWSKNCYVWVLQWEK